MTKYNYNIELIDISDNEDLDPNYLNTSTITLYPKDDTSTDSFDSHSDIELSSDSDLELYNNPPNKIINVDTIKDIPDYNQDTDIILIQNPELKIKDQEIIKFIDFCKSNNYFDDTYYDYRNAFSIIATKLPLTFEKMTNNPDSTEVDTKTFIHFFKQNNYPGNIEYISKQINKNRSKITWDNLLEFFLPFIKYVTY